jgi:hypothetical protein
VRSFFRSVASVASSGINQFLLVSCQRFMLTSVLRLSVRRVNLSVPQKRVQHGLVVNFAGVFCRNRCGWRHTRSFSSTSKVSADVIEEKIFPTEKIRNIAIIAHGKCSLLFAGVICCSCAEQLIMARPLSLTSFYVSLGPSNNSRKPSRLSSR